MRLRFKSLLTFIFILIVCCITMGVGYKFYKDVRDNETVVIVDGNITINYLNGNRFSAVGNDELQFSVTNNSKEEAYFYIRISDVLGDTDSVSYEITSDSSDLNISNKLKSDIVSNSVTVDANKTNTYTIKFKTDSEEKYSGKIIIGSKQNEIKSFADTIINNNKVQDKSITSIGENSDKDEGLIKSTDDLGTSYYFRGNVKNNYVSFANSTWRIVKINGDGSIKMVLNTITESLTKYYEGNSFEYDGSKVNETLDAWYKNNLDGYSSFIANYKFCNDYILEDGKKVYTSYNRIAVNKIPAFECLGATSNEKIGLLTADEVMLAGGSLDRNDSYYLYNKDIKTDYFTMTSAKISEKYSPFIVTIDGSLNTETDGTLLRAIRPVINIVKSASVIGDGTEENPYVINE